MSRRTPRLTNGFAPRPEDDFRILEDHEGAVTSPALLAGRAMWEQLRGDRPMPSRADFDPADAPRSILPHIMLVEIHRAPDIRFRFRLIGTHITSIMDRDSTGRWLDELYNEREYEVVTTGYFRAMESLRPVSTLARAPSADRSFLEIEAVDLPLSPDGRTVDMIMTFCHIHSPAPRRPGGQR